MNLTDKQSFCCFTGHRNISKSELLPLGKSLENAIITLYQRGVHNFVAGGALGFDTLAAQTVLRLCRTLPQLRLILVLPCEDQAKHWQLYDRKVYKDIINRAHEVICLNKKYTTGCMHQRNKYMVNMSGHCVAYYIGGSGGTSYTLGLAKENNLEVINLYEANEY